MSNDIPHEMMNRPPQMPAGQLQRPMQQRPPGMNPQRPVQKTKMSDYWPLFVVVLVAIISTIAWNTSLPPLFNRGMSLFMGLFLLQLATLKLFDVGGFATAFQKYDMLAKNFRPYALAYPFIELFLALAYIANYKPWTTNTITLVIMLFGTIGVMLALGEKKNLQCACMGNILKVPLTTVTLFEDLGMATMAAMMLVFMTG